MTSTEYDGRSYPTISPYLYYEDLAAAIDWLVDAFGFEERMREVRPDGTLGHCEIALGDGVVMLGDPPDYQSPRKTGLHPYGVYVHVPDVDAHYKHAKAAGAEIDMDIADQPYGVRSYGAHDLEGNTWWFSTPLPSAGDAAR